MSTWALVPVKAPALAKSRLAAELDASTRERLVRAMLQAVLASLRQVRGLDGVAVVSPEIGIGGDGVRHLTDPGGGLNAALAHALMLLARDGASSVLTIAADTPLVTPGEIAAVLQAGHEAAVVLAPDVAKLGTNALLLSPPLLLPPRFGARSHARHVAAARRLGVPLRILHLPGLARDIDRPADLAWLRGGRAGGALLHAAAGVAA